MANGPQIVSENIQLQNGTVRMTNYEFTGEKSVKLFSVMSDQPFQISLDPGSSGPFRIVPTGGNFVFLPGGATVTFALIYDASLGGATACSMTASVPIYAFDGSSGPTGSYTSVVLIGPTAPVTFTVSDSPLPTKRDLGPLLTINEDQDYTVLPATAKVTDDESSFGLVRTNPKLTGNVKITTDSAGGIWLNSIDAEKELADDRFKKFQLNPESSYAIDAYNFFDTGKTPPEIVYSLFQEDDRYTSTKRNFHKQYDKFYQYGAYQLNNKYYDEDFAIFAPIYLKKEIPSNFVIFRTDGALNPSSYNDASTDWSKKFTSEILKNSQIVKVFDLGETSKLGKYLRNIVNHPARRESDIVVSFQQQGYTTFNGIAYSDGSFAEKGELLSEFFDQENPLTITEEFITLGFSRNKVLSSHVVNLEFLFDDPAADDYTINRYFGLYVDTIDLATFELNDVGLQEYSKLVGQTPYPRKGVDGSRISEKSFVQNNPDGIRVYADAKAVKRLPERDTQKMFTSFSKTFAGATSSFYTVLDGDWTYRASFSVGDTINFTVPLAGITASATVSGISTTFIDSSTQITFDNSSYSSAYPLATFISAALNGATLEFYSAEKAEEYRDSVFNSSHIKDTSRIFYLKDRIGNFYDVKDTRTLYAHLPTFQQEKVIEFSLKQKSIDMVDLAGFTDILTQEPVTLLEDKGRSSISFQVTNYLSPNDFIEIRWANSSYTQDEYPLRWRIVANDSGLAPGEIWPTSSLATDAEGEYFLTYFHPGDSTVTLDVLCKTIEKAFRNFPYKNYEVLAKNDTVYFRCTQEGLASTNEVLLYSTYLPNLKVMGLTSTSSGFVNFIGGSDRKRVRVKVIADVAEGMLPDEYISTKGSFSLSRKYIVNGTQIGFSPYVDEPVYDENSELIDFKDADTHRTVGLANELQEIQLTTDKRFTSYKLFEPTFGIFSVKDVKDFDTDFYDSDYIKSYVPELSRYFARYAEPLTIQSIVGATVTFDKDVTFDTVQNVPFLKISPNGETQAVLFNETSQFSFAIGTTNTAGYISKFLSPEIAVGDTVLLMPGENGLFFDEDDLAKFKGFMSLSGVVSDSDEKEFLVLEHRWDPSRFLTHLLNSEYDRMAENYLKTFVLKSRVVPYIAKWVSTRGKDIRDNPYRFNYHRVFGNMNFSPSAEIPSGDSRYHTHEWPYLDKVPYGYNVEKFGESTFSYFFEPLDFSKYQLSSLKKDWFLEYFTVGFPSEYSLNSNNDFTQVPLSSSERYSSFKFDPYVEKTYTLFRGQKLQIDELDATTGNVIAASQKYDSYKFSSIIISEEENPLVNEDPVTFKTYVNEKWKFIVTTIKVKTSSYRNPTGNLGYVDLYTLQNSNDKVLYTYGTGSLGGLSTYTSATPSDKKISVPINFAAYSSDTSLINPIDFYDAEINDPDNSPDLTSEIVPLASGNYSHILGLFESGIFSLSYFLPRVVSPFNGSVVQMSPETIYYKTPFTPAISGTLPFFITAWNGTLLFHSSGGNNSLKGIKERLSFFEISKVMQGSSAKNKMEYEVYHEDGSTSTNPGFAFTIVPPDQITRVFEYVPVLDTDKPAELFNYKDIGYVLNEIKDLQQLYRYQGEFSPKFRDVLKFWMREDLSFSAIAGIDMLLSNTHFGTELPGFSILKNQFYSKVADTEILRISQNSTNAEAYQSVYPLVNEISIDKKEDYAWSSSWDQNYYRKYTSVNEFTPVRGTDEMTEIKSLFGSKMMRLPKEYKMFEFQTFKATTPKGLAVINGKELTYLLSTENSAISTNKTSTALKEEQVTTDIITLNVNIYERLIREMLGTTTDLRAKTEFYRIMNSVPGTFDPTKIDTQVLEYLVTNIIPLFEIKEVYFYLKQTGDDKDRPVVETYTMSGKDFTLSQTQLTQKGYKLKKGVKVSSLGNNNPLQIQITMPFDTRYYTSVSVGVSVHRI